MAVVPIKPVKMYLLTSLHLSTPGWKLQYLCPYFSSCVYSEQHTNSSVSPTARSAQADLLTQYFCFFFLSSSNLHQSTTSNNSSLMESIDYVNINALLHTQACLVSYVLAKSMWGDKVPSHRHWQLNFLISMLCKMNQRLWYSTLLWEVCISNKQNAA